MNHVQLLGRLEEVNQRWTPDGSLSVVASLYIVRPKQGALRASEADEQPLPLRGLGEVAQSMVEHAGQQVYVEGLLRRRYYRQDGVERWGQVEIWAQKCCAA
ncbi:MAG: hypothetical protein HQM07_09050 [Zetaproteobacteria bacterium]|nr:hypothetical protein [Zetaproteobacteria bacterium]